VRRVKAANVFLVAIVAGAISSGVSLYSSDAQSGYCEAVCCPFQVLGDLVISNDWSGVDSSISDSFQSSFSDYSTEQNTHIDQRIQATSIGADAVINNDVNINNLKIVNQSFSPPERCTTENVNASIPQVESNTTILRNDLNKELVTRADKGISRPVALAKADVAAANEDGSFDGNDTVTNLLYPPGLVYRNDKQRQAAKSFVDRIVLPIWPAPVPKASESSNTGILYKKRRLDFLAKINLVQNSYSQVLAENEVQDGLLAVLKKDLDENDTYALKLLNTRDGEVLTQASANTMINFEAKRRFSPYWQESQAYKFSDSLWKEITNLNGVNIWLEEKRAAQDERIELLYATLLSYGVSENDKARLEAIYTDL